MKTVPLPMFSKPVAGLSAPAPKLAGWAFLRLGFRPFYLGGALVAALLVPLWVALFLGAMRFTAAVPSLLWHAHEMLYGFAVAIIVGFLLTAGKTWTGLATPRGPALGALVLLWLAARLAGLAGSALLYAWLDVALLPLVAGLFTVLLLRAKNYRNLPLALMLMLLATANALFHLGSAGVLNIAPMQPLYAALALITLIETVIAGRVIPSFTMAVNPGLKLPTQPWLERGTMGLTALGLLLWVLAPTSVTGAVVLLLAALLQGWRSWTWRPALALKRPILLILHAAYAWIALGLALLALAQLDWVPVSAAVHALGLGATGGLIIGMVTRTARGHTGRPISASSLEQAMYALVMLAVLGRVLASLLPAAFYSGLLVLAALAWSMAFALYLWQFTPWLMRTRLDGKDG